MSLINWLIKRNKGVKDDQQIADTGFCPNCWGSQEYDGKFVQAIKDKQVDINNGEASHAFIQEFVKTHLEPITLKNHNVYDQCTVCMVKYAKSS